MAKHKIGRGKNLPSQLKHHTSFLISDVARLQRTIMDRRTESYGLTRSQWWLISYLIYFDGATQQELADAMEISKGGLTKLLERLEKKDMIERRPHEEDQRSKRIFLRKEARKLSQSIEHELSEAANESFSELDSEETRQLNHLLTRIRERILHLRG